MYLVRFKLSGLPNVNFTLCQIYNEYDKALEAAKEAYNPDKDLLASFYSDVEILKINIEDIIKVEK